MNYSIIKTGKSWKITYREYNKLNRIRYDIQLNKELMHTTLSHYKMVVTNLIRTDMIHI